LFRADASPLRDYVSALLQKQVERKNKLERELRKEKENLRAMQREVQEMKKDLEQRQRCKQTMSLPIVSSVVDMCPDLYCVVVPLDCNVSCLESWDGDSSDKNWHRIVRCVKNVNHLN
jgi:hypothetical protein